MSVQYLGALGFRRQPGSRYRVQRNGLATYDETWIGTPSATLVFAQGDNPSGGRYPNVVLLEWEIGVTQNAEVQIDLHFEGLETSGINNDVMVDRVIEGTLSTEPIDTHPEFAGVMGDLSTGPWEKIVDGKAVYLFANGAVFEAETRRFLYFTTYLPDTDGNLTFDTINPDAGIQNYLAPSISYTESLLENAWPDLEDLGWINTPSAAPVLPTGRTWLLNRIRSRNIADQYFETQIGWQASGPRGWNETWYTKPATP